MNRKTLPILIIIFLLTVVVTLAPEIIGDEMVEWCDNNLKPIFGENYKGWLFGFIVLTIFVLTFLTTDLSSFSYSKNKDRPLNISAEENEKNYLTIRQYLRQRYERRLNQKLAGRQPVNLRRIPTDEGTTEETSAIFVTYKSEEIGPTLASDFREAHGRLLVTGAPGTGKTTLLLQLALELNATEKEHLPVLLNLATWSNEFNSLDEWLREILPAELGVTKKYAAEILKQDRLILLLDGFDEMKKDYRSSSLEAIGIYGSEARRRYIISSRKNEYKGVAKDAPVWLQVEVGPLTFEQLEAELKRILYSQPEAPPLLNAFRNDPLLREAAQVPFYFNTLQLLFSGGKKLSDFNFQKNTVEGRQAEIMERFVERELNVKNSENNNSEKIRHWVSFFASRLTQRDGVVFELVDLQYGWWRWGWYQYITSKILGWLEYFAMVILFLSQSDNFYGLFFIVFFSLFTARHKINSKYYKNGRPRIFVKNINWSIKPIMANIWLTLLTGLSLGVMGGNLYGIKNGFFLGVVAIFLRIFLDVYRYKSYPILQITTPYQRFTASAKALHFSILQHGLLRWQLYHAGALPLRLVDFLNEMSERHILETDGATWRFRHSILQEYFSELWEKENPKFTSP